MEHLIIINIAILLTLTFLVIQKGVTILENIFIFMVLEFIITNYFSIVHINYNLFEIKDNIAFAVYQIMILPLIYLFYFNIITNFSSAVIKVLCTFGAVVIAYGVEFLLVQNEGITYIKWNAWYSLGTLLSCLVLTVIFLGLFRRVLRQEGVLKNDLTSSF